MPFGNWLLTSLDADQRGWLGPLECEPFEPHDVLIGAEVSPEKFWFIERGFISITVPMLDGKSAEVGFVDCGIMPIQALWGDEPAGVNFIAQTPGVGYWAKPSVVRRAQDRYPLLRREFNNAKRIAWEMLARTSACSALHSHEHTIVRRLLAMSRHEATIPMTQEFLADQLGFSRGRVGGICTRLERAALIRHTRGSIEILDRAGLKKHTCECYETIEEILRQRIFKKSKI